MVPSEHGINFFFAFTLFSISGILEDMDDNYKIYRRYLEQKKEAKVKIEPVVYTEYDETAKNTIRSIRKHKKSVKRRLQFIARELLKRAESHDDSKLQYPELGWLITMDKEGKVPYGSPEYFEKQKRWKCFFDHHYSLNPHHPDHFSVEGTNGMSIIDIVEMVCDVISYFDDLPTEKAFEIIKEQKGRFGFSDELANIMVNTLTRYFTSIGGVKPEFDPKKIKY